MIPSEGQLQALYPIPRDHGIEKPDEVTAPGAEPMRPDPSDRGTPQSPSAGEAAWQTWQTAHEAYTAYQAALSRYETYGGYTSRLAEWAATFRPITGLTAAQYTDARLVELARSARSCIAMELCGLDPEDGEAVTTWVDPDGTAYTARRIPDDVIRTAVGYLARAMFFDGAAKWDEWQMRKFEADAEIDGKSSLDGEGRQSYLRDGPGREIVRETAMGPRGSSRLINASGAMRLIAPYVRRRLIEVL